MHAAHGAGSLNAAFVLLGRQLDENILGLNKRFSCYGWHKACKDISNALNAKDCISDENYLQIHYATLDAFVAQDVMDALRDILFLEST